MELASTAYHTEQRIATDTEDKIISATVLRNKEEFCSKQTAENKEKTTHSSFLLQTQEKNY